jgi:signal transduction histidine kinase
VDAVLLFATHLASALEVAQSIEALTTGHQEIVKRERIAALGELAAIVAHEIRNPLGVLFNSLGSLHRIVDRNDGDARVFLDIAIEETERLDRVIGDLLEFAKPTEPDFALASLVRIASEASATLKHKATTIETDSNLPEISIDSRLVRRALVNVMLNAMQAMSDDGVLRVSVRSTPNGQSIEVCDTGAGIPLVLRPNIFEPFFTTKPTGAGLGLAIVKRIMDVHGARIAIDTSTSGTTFKLLFPNQR